MSNFKKFALASVAAGLAITSANAADLLPPPPAAGCRSSRSPAGISVATSE